MAQNAFLDFLQAASNAAASNISGPVDLLGMGLRGAGVPVPKNALMSSQWMEERGLTKKPANALANVAGETAGMVSPIALAAKAPQVAGALLQSGRNLAAPRTLNSQSGALVWHGSPYKFDAFDSSRIGSGEGAQAYGHGLYLADAPEVAVGYQKALAHKAPRIQDEAGKMADYQTTVKGRNAWVFTDESVLIETADGAGFKLAASLRDLRKKASSDSQAFEVASRTDFAAQAKSNLYKVDLPDEHIARMLDWDKPLSQQGSGVQQAADRMAGERMRQLFEVQKPYMVNKSPYDTLTGQELYRGLHEAEIAKGMALPAAEKERLMVERLRKAGVPGIRYLDGGSRGAGAGSSNYVIFPQEERMLNILERNGQKVGR